MTPEALARIVKRSGEPGFVNLLRAADADFADAAFELALAKVLRDEPQLVELWDTWSGDQRWTPSAYISGNETGWYNAGSQQVRTYLDQAAAVADFIHRMATWLARHEMVEVER